jgi:hypothetical protein
VWIFADDATHLSHSTCSHENVEVGAEANYFYPTAMALSRPMTTYVILIISGVDFSFLLVVTYISKSTTLTSTVFVEFICEDKG